MNKTIMTVGLIALVASSAAYAASPIQQQDPSAAGQSLYHSGFYAGGQGGVIFGYGGADGALMGNLGYQFNEHFAIESSVTIPMATLDMVSFTTLDAKLIMPVNNGPVAFYVKAGPALSNVDFFGYDLHQWNISGGAGMDYALNRHVTLEAGYQNVGGKLNFVTGGVAYHFG